MPLAPDRHTLLLEVLRRTRIGGMVAAELDKLRVEGGGERPLRLVEVRREGGPWSPRSTSTADRCSG